MDELLETLRSALLELDREATLAAVRAVLREGPDHAEAAVGAVTEALDRVGRRFQEGDWFLGELVYSGEIAKEAMELLSPHLRAGSDRSLGTVVVGTVQGDMHDLGKNIFISYARSAGFAIVDLGTDVTVEHFAEAALQHRPLALGMSCLLTVSAGAVGRVIEGLRQRGLRESVKIIVGGAALTEEFAREVGADAFAPDAVTGTGIVRAWSRG